MPSQAQGRSGDGAGGRAAERQCSAVCFRVFNTANLHQAANVTPGINQHNNTTDAWAYDNPLDRQGKALAYIKFFRSHVTMFATL